MSEFGKIVMFSPKEVSGNYVLSNYDNCILHTTGSSNATLTLPQVLYSKSKFIYIQKVDTGAGNTIVTAYSGDTIAGASSVNIVRQYEAKSFLAINTNQWLILDYLPWPLVVKDGKVGIGTTEPGSKLDVYGGQIAMRGTDNLWSSGENKVRNGGFRDGYDGSSTGKGWSITDVTGTHDASYPQVWETFVDWTLRDGDTNTEGNYGSTLAVYTTYLNGEFYVYSDFFKLTAGRSHTFQALMGNVRMNWLKLRLVTYLSDKATSVNTYYGTLQGDGSTTQCSTYYSGGKLASGYCNMWGTFTPGDTEKYARIELVANGYASGNTDGWMFADQVAVIEGSQPLAWTPRKWEMNSAGDIYSASGYSNLIIKSSGKVGIGTTEPGSKLEVVGDIKAFGEYQFTGAGGVTHYIRKLSSAGASPSIMFRLWNGTSNVDSAALFDSGNVWLGGTAANTSPTIAIQETGKVGIGTTSPDGQLSTGLANGQQISYKSLTELTTIAAAAYTDTTIQIPANVIVKAVSVRVVTTIPTATTFTVTGATSTTVFNTAAVSTAAGSTNKGNLNCPYNNGAAQKIRITPNATPGSATGQVRITIWIEDSVPPTS